MPARLDITASLPERGGNRMVLRRFVLALCAMLSALAAAESGFAQERWTYDTAFAFEKPFVVDPQVAFDPWGNRHYAWVSYDPNSSGYQIFYTNDATGAVGAPFLATDIGSLYYDSVGVDSSMIFLLDRSSVSHFLFMANVAGPNGMELGLYYTNNRDSEFRERNPVLLTNGSGRYDMAVDSAGTAHVIWLEENPGNPPEVWYWNARLPVQQKRKIGDVPCVAFPCRFGDPQVEASGSRLAVFVRFDPGAVYRITVNGDGTVTSPQAIPLPQYDPLLVAQGKSDLHMRAAVDPYGAYHLLLPCRSANAPLQLLYVTDASGAPVVKPLVTIDSSLHGFDITTDGGDRLAAVWTTHRGRFAADRPMTGLAEYRRAAPGIWQEIARIDDLNAIVGNPAPEWRWGDRAAMMGDRLNINGVRFKVDGKGDTVEFRQGAFVRHSVDPQTAYMLPDAGAPGMSVVVETFAPPAAFGSFGPDTLDPASVGLELVNPADSSRIVVGPSVVSWSGRLVSTMLFLRPDAAPGEVPVRVRVGDRRSNEQIFSIVTPQRLGSNGSGRLTGGGALGSGGIYGTRSPRGVLVVDTLILADGTYTVWYDDTDPATAGNQGMLPLTILARGPVIIDSNAVLSVSAPAVSAVPGTAGPGGGGGGAGLLEGGGAGFTAGGGPGGRIGRNGYDGTGTGSGGNLSGRYVAGGSVGGAHGGAARPGVPSGGGTGHPFGASGRYGRGDSLSPVTPDNGGFGGGTGGNLYLVYSTGGGGGSHASRGEDGGIARNAGQAVGSSVLVPLAGGGGGGGAASVNGLAGGGGGGGALAIFSYREIDLLGEIRADGGDGYTDTRSAVASGGGGGGGGGVLMGAQDRLLIGPQGKISAAGGTGGEMRGGSNFVSGGGDGSHGRVRLDGRIDYRDSVVQFAYPSPGYYGPSTGMNGSFRALGNDTIAGTGIPGKRVRVYVRPKAGEWFYNRPKDVLVDTAGEWTVALEPDEAAGGLVYAVAMQEVEDPSSDPRTARPRWVMSSAGGNIVGRPAAQLSADNLDFGCVAYPECRTLNVVVTNSGEQSDLQIYGRALNGSDWFSMVSQEALLRIRPGESRTIQIRFCPEDTGVASASLRLFTNLYPDPVRTISLSGCGISGRLNIALDTIDLGEMCPGVCRDTVLTLTNEGDAVLRVTELAADEKWLTLEFPDGGLPMDIPPGASRTVRLRACLKGGDGIIGVSPRTVTPPSIRTKGFVFRVVNMGPQPELPAALGFDLRDLGKGDTCRLDTLILKNRSTRNAMAIEGLTATGEGFEVISPPSGTLVPPGGSVRVILRFCPDRPGDYNGRLQLKLETGACVLDTAVALAGSVARSLPDLQIEGANPSENISIFFGSVPVGLSSPLRDVVLHNFGEGTAPGVTYRFLSGGDNFEVFLSPGNPPPFDMPGDSIRTLSIRAVPRDTGTHAGLLEITAADGWRREVALTVNGVKPGIVPEFLTLDFGDIRKGENAFRNLKIYNRGSLAGRVAGLEIADSADFFFVSAAPSLSSDLDPGEHLVASFRFTPREEGRVEDTLYVRSSAGGTEVIPVILTGRGLYERGEADVSQIEFDCTTPVKVVTVRNSGSWTLKIDRLELTGRDAGRFRLLDRPAPDSLRPGEWKGYRVEYIPGPSEALAFVTVQHSAGQIPIELKGALCEDELFRLAFSLPDLEGTVGSLVYIPLELQADGPVPEDVPFRLLVRYEWSLLMPEFGLPGQKVASDATADGVKMSEKKPGELTIEGTVRNGSVSGELLQIPMRVLLGRTYRTGLALEEAPPSGLPAGYRIALDSGSFLALDCDTSGTIDISGRYGIKQNVPNPFSEGTTIRFEIARREPVLIVLYDAAGNMAGTLLDDVLEKGEHELLIPAGAFPAGLYFYEITSGRFRAARSMLIVE